MIWVGKMTYVAQAREEINQRKLKAAGFHKTQSQAFEHLRVKYHQREKMQQII